jgi:hypothetical protein
VSILYFGPFNSFPFSPTPKFSRAFNTNHYILYLSCFMEVIPSLEADHREHVDDNPAEAEGGRIMTLG